MGLFGIEPDLSITFWSFSALCNNRRNYVKIQGIYSPFCILDVHQAYHNLHKKSTATVSDELAKLQPDVRRAA